MKNKSKGFVVIASKRYAFYQSAINLIESLLDYYPEAKVTLFTDLEWVDKRAKEACDQIFPCPDHVRAKMYGMQNTPYDLTFYIDADCEIQHEDIVNVWDQLGDNDMCFVRLEKDEVSQRCFEEVYARIEGTDDMIDLQLCGGVCLYDHSKPIVKEFMKDWWELFKIQEDIYQMRKKDPEYDNDSRWWHNGVPHSMLRWDQFTLWWMVNKMDKYKDIKIGRFNENYRWNWFTGFKMDSSGKHRLVDKHPIVVHYSASMDKFADYR